MEPLTDIPKSLQDDLRDRRIIPFIGAGVSMAVLDRQTGKTLFPSWAKLLTHAANRLRKQKKHPEADVVESLLRVNDYLDAANRARTALGPVWYQFLKDKLGHQKKHADDKSLDLARAIWELGSYLVITTNYDRVLRWACPETGDLSAWDIEAPAEQATALREGLQRHTLWYLHGHIDNAAKLILTPDGYSRLYPATGNVENRYQAALKTLHSLLTSKSFLFVGFSLDDVYFVRELQNIDNIFEASPGPHYVLIRKDDEERVRMLNLPVETVAFREFGQPLLDLLRAMGEYVHQTEQPSPETTPPGNVTPWHEKEPPHQPLFYRRGEIYFPSKFIGREKEISDLLKFLRERRLVTLLATGGIGKTRLALETVARLGNLSLAFLGAVSLEDVQEDSDSAVLAAFEAALGLDLERQGSEMAALLTKLQSKQGLLLIDNCETAPRALASLVDTLLRKTAIRILTTSQSPLGLLGAEQVFRLEPMQQPPKTKVLTLAELQHLDSFHLFQDRASLDSEWHPDDRDAPAIADILRLTDGIPLALELVAAWTPYRELTRIAEEIRLTPFSQITAPEGHHDKRHSSLRRCFDWSFNHLPDFAQEGFASTS